jgi:hypothetical protein
MGEYYTHGTLKIVQYLKYICDSSVGIVTKLPEGRSYVGFPTGAWDSMDSGESFREG